MNGFFLALGGGAGDVWVDFLDHPLVPYLPGIVQDCGYPVRVHTCTHCDVSDLFRHHPYICQHIKEGWELPSPEQTRRFNNPIDDWLPLNANNLSMYGGPVIRRETPRFFYTANEERYIEELLSQRPCIVMQPYAGLSDRDGFDPERLGLLCNRLVELEPNCRVLVLGFNHERGHKYVTEECHFEHPRVLNLIDQLGLRTSISLTAQCDAFAGCHSNLIRAAWRWRRRNACVLPHPLMTDALSQIDARYLYGFNHPETRTFTYNFASGGERHFETLDIESIAKFLLGRE